MHDESVLIQAASGACESLLELTCRRHGAWARLKHLDYWWAHGRVCERSPHWDKIALIKKALAVGYANVIWLDADTLVTDVSADPTSALNQGKQLGMVFIDRIPYGGSFGHYQTGAIYIRSGPEVKQFIQDVWQWGVTHEDAPYWHEQAALNELLTGKEPWVQKISDRWNSTWCMNPCAEPVVMAWHGTHPDKLERMKVALQSLEAL